MIKEKDFEFSYKGDNYIDINTLLASQFHFAASLSEIQKELYPDVDLKIKIGAFKEGSFVVQLLMETTFLQQMFTKDNGEVIKSVLETFVAYVSIHKFLFGKKPEAVKETDDSVTLSNINNSTITINKQVYNIYKHNTVLSQSMQKNFETLSKDPSIEGIEITPDHEAHPILSIPQEEFADLSKPNPYLDKEQNEEIIKNETVYIKKPNLFPEKGKVWNWELFYKGRDIKAKIEDPDFERKINDGMRVAQGDRLEVDLKIFYKWHERFSTFIESGRFEIIKVHRLIERPLNPKMFPDNKDQ